FAAIRLLGADVAAPPIGRIDAAARGIFPLRLGRQPIGLAGLLRQPGHECLGVEPADIDDRPVAASPFAVVGPVLAAAFLDALVPFVERDLRAADGERLVELHHVNRALVFRRRSHLERAGGDYDELAAIIAIAEDVAGLGRRATRPVTRLRRGYRGRSW